MQLRAIALNVNIHFSLLALSLFISHSSLAAPPLLAHTLFDVLERWPFVRAHSMVF